MHRLAKTFLGLLFGVTTLSGCHSSTPKALIEREEGISEIIDLTATELNTKIGSYHSFILLTYDETCLCSINFRTLLNRIMKEKEIRIYQITDREFFQTALSQKITISLPELTILRNGDENIRSVHAYKKWEKEINAPKEDGSMKPILSYLNQYADLEAPLYYLDAEKLRYKIANKDTFFVYYMRFKCTDCRYFDTHFLHQWLVNDAPKGLKLYALDVDPYRDLDATSYQALKDEFGLSKKGNAFFGYLEGVVPTLQSYVNGALSDMAVIFNDVFEEGTYQIQGSYYEDLIGTSYDNYDQYHKETISFYQTKFLEVLEK